MEKSKQTSAFLVKQQVEVFKFRHALSSESDRGCALYAASYLDSALSDLLYVVLVSDNRIENDLFKRGPLSNFSPRIKIAYYLGCISASCRTELEQIQSIRNRFGHSPEPITFETKGICEMCKNLQYSYQEKTAPARDHFTASVLGILANILHATYSTPQHQPKPDDLPSEKDKQHHREFVEKLRDKLKTTEQDNPRTSAKT
jgi:DNA-binding MltR family transcriptional regulator